MRYINRNEISKPDYFDNPEIQKYNQEVKEHLKSKTFKRVEQPDNFSKSIHLIKDDLKKLFRNKCAYCESILDTNEMNIDHFRPIAGAQRFDGFIDSKHYSWLAYDWENIYLICQRCNIQKGRLFPVKKAGVINSSISRLRKIEGAFLLDPCWDKPEKHLSIGSSGILFSLSQKGQTSIKILGLNRVELVNNRSSQLNSFKKLWQYLQENPIYEDTVSQYEDLVHSNAPYSGIIRLLIQHILKYIGKRGNQFTNFDSIDTLQLLEVLKQFGPRSLEDFFNQQRDKLVENENIREAYYIKSVKIHNYKGINEFYLEFPEKSKDKASCKALIGVNTIGKTTILQAIALGVLGPEKAIEVCPDARKCLSDNNEEGSIEIKFWNELESNIIRFSKNSQYFSGEIPISALFMGYGSYRLAAKGLLGQHKRQSNYRALTLFDEHECINGPAGLLKRYSDPALHSDIASTLDMILKNEAAYVNLDTSSNLRIFHNGQSHKLENFSSGYQSIISFVTDIMDVLYSRWNSMDGAQGIVVVDELDAHLHPEWKFKIVTSLRNAFPGVQFIFSTHDPLILRGLSSEEVSILERDENGIVRDSGNVPSVMDGLDIDQLLTSIFGLQNTMRPELENMFTEYYSLLSSGESDLQSKKGRLEELEDSLSAFHVLGRTKRERLMYRLIDIELSKSTQLNTYHEWSEESIIYTTEKILNALDSIDD